MAAGGGEAVTLEQLKHLQDAQPSAPDPVTYSLRKSGSTIYLDGSDGSSSHVTDSNTTYSTATTSTAGLMSASDKTKLNGLSSGGGPSFTRLYYSSTGSRSVSCSSSVSNYDMIAITFKDDQSRRYSEVIYTNGSSSFVVSASRTVYNNSNGGSYLESSIVNVSGRSISMSSDGQSFIGNDNSCSGMSTSRMKIVAVVGINF